MSSAEPITELTIVLRANDFPSLLAAVKRLQGDLEASGASLGEVALTGETEVTATIGKRRGRPPKAEKEAATQPATETAPVTAPDAGEAPVAANQSVAPEPQAEVPQVNAVADLSPEDARKSGIEEMQRYFGRNPNAMPEIKRLQTKYGVKMFQDIPDDQAHAFLADVKLLVSGSAQAA